VRRVRCAIRPVAPADGIDATPAGGHRPARTIAIGDIHGCSTALRTLINMVAPGPADTVVTLCDHNDRVLDTRGVLDWPGRLFRRALFISRRAGKKRSGVNGTKLSRMSLAQ